MPRQADQPRRARAAITPAGTGFLLQSAPGLERILWQEIHELVPGARRTGTATLPRRNGILYMEAEMADFEELLQSRIAEDVFVTLARGPIDSGVDGLAGIDALAAGCTGIDEALHAHARLHGGRGAHPVSTFRVVVRAAGDRAYRRVDVQHRVAAILARRLGRRWRSVDDTGQVEFWLTLLGNEAVLALRLTDATQRHREKAAHIPGSLRPSVAAALVRLSQPRPDDVVLDPFCGAGTILIERGAVSRHARLIGSDISVDALVAAQKNIGSRHKPLDLHEWDAAALPLDPASIDAVITNPPFGIKVGGRAEAGALLPRFLAEAHRVLKPGGRLVMLSGDPARLVPLLEDSRWAAVRSHPVEVQGRAAAAVSGFRV